MTTLIEDIEALRRELGVQNIALLGHSFGGLLALEYAAKYPRNVSHLIFVAGVWAFDLQCRLRFDSSVRVRMDSVNAARNARNTGELSRGLFQGGLLRYQFRAFDRLTMPVLVVAGRFDGAARPDGLRELARRLPNARFAEYERSGHFVYLDEPDRFAREVSSFLLSR